MAARITRAKRALRDARVAFEVPVGAELAGRFADVLEVVYLIFNEGYAATSGESWYRADLCDEAMRLGRMLAALAPPSAASEAYGLVALLEIQASRIPARTGPDGMPVTLPDQDRGRWNRLLITHGLAALATARSLTKGQPGGTGQARPYLIQAELAACHARAFLLPAVGGDLLARLGQTARARAAFECAAALTENASERARLLRRAAAGG